MTYEDLKTKITIAKEAHDENDYNRAERLAKEALAEMDVLNEPLTRDPNWLSIRAKGFEIIGRTQLRHGDFDLSIETLNAARSLYEQASDSEGITTTGILIGNVYLNLSDYAKALEYFESALALCDELGLKTWSAIVIGNVGLVYSSLADYPRALECMNRALGLHEDLGMKDHEARVLGNIGNLYQKISNYPLAIENLSRALSFYEELGQEAQIANVSGNLGVVYAELSDYHKSLEYLSRALTLHEQTGQKADAAVVLGNIGMIHRGLQDYPKALEYLSRALANHEELGMKEEVAVVTGSIGSVHSSLSDLPKALEYMNRAITLSTELGLKANVATVTGNIGLVYLMLSDFSKALDYYTRAIVLNEELGLKSNVATFTGNVGGLYAKKEFDGYDAVKAEEYLLRAVAMNEKLGTRHLLYDNHRSLAELYEHQQRWRESQQHFKKYHELEREVLSEEAKRKADQIDAERRQAVREKQVVAERAAQKAAADATTHLLHKVLPSSIATRIMSGEKIADYFPLISILFADIVGFTPIAARMPAKSVLAFLNYVFGEFDAIIEKHGCEKIKTIGDGYMAVAGAPIECADHAERSARAASELMREIHLPEEIRKSLPKDAEFQIRIGLHCGSAFAGIVGENRFVYDVYSDAVNLAARMESSGVPGKIQCSADFAHHLQNRGDGFMFEERGEMEIKGKGMMRTFFLVPGSVAESYQS